MMKNAILTSETDGLAKNWLLIYVILGSLLWLFPKQLQLLTISSISIIISIIAYISYMYIVQLFVYNCTLIIHVLKSYPIKNIHGTFFGRGSKVRGVSFMKQLTKGSKPMLEKGTKVQFCATYDGYFRVLKGLTFTIASCYKDDLNNGFYMVKLEEIEEQHLINSLWLEVV